MVVKNFIDDISIVLCGEAGQGIQTIESILALIIKKSGFNIFSTKEYMSRVRGGTNSTTIRMASQKSLGQIKRIDLLISLTDDAEKHLSDRITASTIILGKKNRNNTDNYFDVNLTELSLEFGNPIFSNIIAVGLIAGLLKIDFEIANNVIIKYFSKKDNEIIKTNIKAFEKGYKLFKDDIINVNIKKNDSVKDEMLISGSDSIAIGALAGGCNYICAYPMSPSTGVFTSIAGYSKTCEIIVEQVEDEIGVINMALGAWYAGARAMVTTSGGGFALMTEGLSLCGMIESPLVILLAQRPGPATGLPTRTEQGDLDLALYAGHGSFPRIIMAPKNNTDAFELTKKSFYLAEKYQVPVIILTDQFFVDSYNNTPIFNVENSPPQEIIKTTPDYKRFSFTKTGVSPRSVPGFGNGFVCLDSDEHNEDGRIAEDPELKIKMTEKRNLKNKEIEKEFINPFFSGTKDAKILIVSWGSTFDTVFEAVKLLDNDKVSHLHFSWLFPLFESSKEYFNKAEKIIVIEGNYNSQFSQLLKTSFDIKIDHKIIKYDGYQFYVEDLYEKLREIVDQE
jgi:2-oxoglutarate/2-oxoacid ferredoxin oxidoreductase subunit alpha